MDDEAGASASVAVIGGGLSGLIAAALLHRAGLRITLFEAESRLGGRVHSFWRGRTRLAMGAMWLHGGLANPLYKPLTQLLGPQCLQAAEKDPSIEDVFVWSSIPNTVAAADAACTESGVDLPLSLMSQATETLRCALASADDEVEFRDRFDLSVADLLSQRKLFDLNSETDDSEKKLFQSALRSVCLQYGKSEGVDCLAQLGVLGQAAYTDHTAVGGNRSDWSAFDRLVSILGGWLPEQCLQLGTKVDRISLTPDGSASLLIDSQWQQFDHALVTVSLGVLQANQLIEPSLVTNERQSALKQMQLGVVDKIFVRLAAPVPLPVDCNHLWIVRQQLCNTWVDGVFSLSVVNKDRDIIMFWIAGDYAKSMEVKSEAELIEDLTKQLEGVFRCAVPEILEIIRSAFGSKQNFLGSYSHFLPGSNPELHSALWDPIKYSASDKPAVCFAGEHTHPCYFSTVHGALLSGVREAVRISQYCKLSVKSSSSTADKFLDSLVQLVSN